MRAAVFGIVGMIACTCVGNGQTPPPLNNDAGIKLKQSGILGKWGLGCGPTDNFVIYGLNDGGKPFLENHYPKSTVPILVRKITAFEQIDASTFKITSEGTSDNEAYNQATTATYKWEAGKQKHRLFASQTVQGKVLVENGQLVSGDHREIPPLERCTQVSSVVNSSIAKIEMNSESCMQIGSVTGYVKAENANDFLDSAKVTAMLGFLWKQMRLTCDQYIKTHTVPAGTTIGPHLFVALALQGAPGDPHYDTYSSPDGVNWTGQNLIGTQMNIDRQERERMESAARQQTIAQEQRQRAAQARQEALNTVANSREDSITKVVKTYNILWGRNVHSAGTTTTGPNVIIQLANPDGSLDEQLSCLKVDQGGYNCSFGTFGRRILN